MQFLVVQVVVLLTRMMTMTLRPILLQLGLMDTKGYLWMCVA